MSILRWVLFVLALLGAMVVASLTATPSEWQLAVQWADEQRARGLGGGLECPVLHGEAAPGSSLAGYLEVIRLAGAVRLREERLRELAIADAAAAVPTAEDRQLLASLEPAVQALREAAHRQGRRDEEESPLEFIDLLGSHDALLWNARDLARAGDVRGAVACLLDALACGVDLVSCDVLITQIVGATLVIRTACAFDDALLVAADAELLANLDAALATADAALPLDSNMMSRSAVHLVHLLRDNEQVTALDLGMASSLQAWRHGFSVRQSGMARATVLVELVQRFERESVGTQAWPLRKVRLQAAVDEDRANNPDLHFTWLSNMVGIEEQRREAAARLRLLRLAVAFHGRQPLGPLGDPLGDAELSTSSSGEAATFASVGSGLERTAHRRH